MNCLGNWEVQSTAQDMAHVEKVSSIEDSPEGSKASSDNAKPSMKVSLMARGKGNKLVLKTVSIEESALHEAWKKEREREEVERADIKRVTLGHTARIFAEEEQEMRQQIYSHSRFN
ncbi:unnamed protein product [Heligmosomoides polygyrus]|uniref:Upf2 domain-containing protein n=1 Tax=Heligmosomoides polygyrus TaxID=6339 RepID=A0A183FI62_HELPZ|nr:unnamed protein product [Heligmosomoides polygyrus]